MTEKLTGSAARAAIIRIGKVAKVATDSNGKAMTADKKKSAWAKAIKGNTDGAADATVTSGATSTSSVRRVDVDRAECWARAMRLPPVDISK